MAHLERQAFAPENMDDLTNPLHSDPAAKAAVKPAAKKLVAVRKAAQKPVHATRSDIRRAVQAVAEC